LKPNNVPLREISLIVVRKDKLGRIPSSVEYRNNHHL